MANNTKTILLNILVALFDLDHTYISFPLTFKNKNYYLFRCYYACVGTPERSYLSSLLYCVQEIYNLIKFIESSYLAIEKWKIVLHYVVELAQGQYMAVKTLLTWKEKVYQRCGVLQAPVCFFWHRDETGHISCGMIVGQEVIDSEQDFGGLTLNKLNSYFNDSEHISPCMRIY